ncbi:MAG: ribosomal protein S18-alanine N-acetyltransferase [Gammaproteobacteria bacterium]|nr:ribosomal protein S18-alanine N-acetyltransferase [Gammaproteobacteria bacterium]
MRTSTAREASLGFSAMTFDDVATVIRIERRSYEFPWTEGIFRDCIRAGYYCVLLTRGREVLGYGVMAVAAEEAHLLNLCIDIDRQGQGYGRRLLDHFVSRARELGAARLLLEVRISNLIAQALYESSGFVQIGIRRSYYPDRIGREDAIVLALALS